jgi:hypothetical protein
VIHKWGTGRLVAARRGSSRLQNGSGSGEDAGRALVGDFLFGLEPVLNITAIELNRYAVWGSATVLS